MLSTIFYDGESSYSGASQRVSNASANMVPSCSRTPRPSSYVPVPPPSPVSLKAPSVEYFQEYDIHQMEARAERFSQVDLLRSRADRFEEEVREEKS